MFVVGNTREQFGDQPVAKADFLPGGEWVVQILWATECVTQSAPARLYRWVEVIVFTRMCCRVRRLHDLKAVISRSRSLVKGGLASATDAPRVKDSTTNVEQLFDGY